MASDGFVLDADYNVTGVRVSDVLYPLMSEEASAAEAAAESATSAAEAASTAAEAATSAAEAADDAAETLSETIAACEEATEAAEEAAAAAEEAAAAALSGVTNSANYYIGYDTDGDTEYLTFYDSTED